VTSNRSISRASRSAARERKTAPPPPPSCSHRTASRSTSAG
jgi:hypothetical protein